MKHGNNNLIIKLCPFCGNNELGIDEVQPNTPAVVCNQCGAIGPHTGPQTQEEAIKRWNKTVRE